MIEIDEGLFFFLDVLADCLDLPLELLERFQPECLTIVDMNQEDVIAWELEGFRQFLIEHPHVQCPIIRKLVSI